MPDNVPLLIGHVHATESGIYTALSCVTQSEGIVSTYYKRFLVPLGEYLPLPFLRNSAKFITAQEMDMLPGKPTQILDLSKVNLPNAHVLICYESVFPQTIFRKQGWIVGVSNDAWFGNSFGPYQHLRWNQIRCLENGIPMMRSTNHGISAVIDARGRLVKWIGLNRAGIIDCCVPAAVCIF